MILLLACSQPADVGAPLHAVVARRTLSPSGVHEAFVRDGSLRVGDTLIDHDVLPELSFAPDERTLVYGREEHGQTDLWRVVLPDGEPERLLDWPGSSEDRPAHGPDGLAFVSGVTGIASLWVLDLESGETLQVTNVGVEDEPRAPGVAPRGFVPPPDPETLRWDDDGVHWVADERAWTVAP